MKIFLIVLAVIAAIAALIACLLFAPIKIKVGYDGEFSLIARYLFISSDLLSEEEDDVLERLREGKKIKVKAGKKKKSKEKKEKKAQKEQDVGSLAKFIAKFQFTMLKTLLPFVKTKIKRYNISVGASDAAKCAVAYGAVSAASSWVFELLSDHAGLSGRSGKNINIKADFLSEHFTADILIIFRFPLFAALKANLAPLILDEGVLLDILENDNENKGEQTNVGKNQD